MGRSKQKILLVFVPLIVGASVWAMMRKPPAPPDQQRIPEKPIEPETVRCPGGIGVDLTLSAPLRISSLAARAQITVDGLTRASQGFSRGPGAGSFHAHAFNGLAVPVGSRLEIALYKVTPLIHTHKILDRVAGVITPAFMRGEAIELEGRGEVVGKALCIEVERK